MATSKLQVYARLARGLGAILIHRYVSDVRVRVHTRKGSTRRVLRVATRVRTCMHARTLDPSECRLANARVHAPGAIPAMRNVSSRTSTGVRKNDRLALSLFLSRPLFFSCLPRAITRAGIKETLN